MNLVIFDNNDVIEISNDRYTVRINDYRRDHIKNILHLNEGDSFRIGKKNGRIGSGLIKTLSEKEMIVEVSLTDDPPSKLPLTLALALPRPLFLRRIISAATSMGVSGFIIFHSFRVEKSYWRSPALKDVNLTEAVLNGLEQSQDTVMPGVELIKSFRSFREYIHERFDAGSIYIAQPEKNDRFSEPPKSICLLIIGPEGGFVRTEIDAFEDLNFRFFHLGERVIKVETAVVAAITKLFL
jgi:RsmE family RNA methyltransferase